MGISLFSVTATAAVLFTCFKTSDENTAAQCAQFGVNDETEIWDRTSKRGYYTIAAEDFDVKYICSIGTRYDFGAPKDTSIVIRSGSDGSCPWIIAGGGGNPRIEPCVPNDKIKISMYLVKQHGHVLKGWLHVEIELLDQSDEMEIVYIQMRDEAFNAIGEFVTTETHPGATCKPTKDNLATPKYYEFFPCSATGLREAKTSAAIMMAKKEYYIKNHVKENHWVHEGSIARGVHFLWTFGEYWCSRHRKIQPYAYILTKKYREGYHAGTEALMLRKIPNYWLHPNWFGAADIILPHGELDCQELAIYDDNGTVSPPAINSWFLNSSIVILKEDNWHPDNRYPVPNAPGRFGSNLCQADPIHPDQKKSTVPVFSGRCEKHFAKDVSTKFFHGCNLDPNSPEFEAVLPILDQFTSYKEYNDKKIADRLALCNNTPCLSPDSRDHLKEIQTFQRGEGGNITKREIIVAGYNDVRTKAKTQKFWHGRKYHGILCTIVTFFLTPMYIFVSRYYKETFMARRCYGVPMWYWVHVFGIILSGVLFSSGYAAITPNFPVWGRSLHPFGLAHAGIGHTSATIFGLLIILGGCRCGTTFQGAGKWLRICTLTCHALLGFLHYFLNFLAVILSTLIPQSPTLKDCDEIFGMPWGFSPIVSVVVAFLAIDLIIYVVLTIIQCTVDRGAGVNRRGWWFPLIPLLPISSITDYAGQALRKIVLILYLVLTLVLTVMVVALIADKELPKHCRIGPMSCKHAFGCTKLAIQYEQWFKSKGGEIDVDHFY